MQLQEASSSSPAKSYASALHSPASQGQSGPPGNRAIEGESSRPNSRPAHDPAAETLARAWEELGHVNPGESHEDIVRDFEDGLNQFDTARATEAMTHDRHAVNANYVDAIRMEDFVERMGDVESESDDDQSTCNHCASASNHGT